MKLIMMIIVLAIVDTGVECHEYEGNTQAMNNNEFASDNKMGLNEKDSSLLYNQSKVHAFVDTCPPSSAIYSFGDSLADTGNIEYVFPYVYPVEHLPYGEQNPFHKPSFRYSDGRLVIDFIAQALSLPFLDPYMQVVSPNYTHGCNFATSGSTATNITPFSLTTQVNQFLRFQSKVLEALQQDVQTTSSINEVNSEDIRQLKIPTTMDSFQDSLYIISIGGNDFMFAYNAYSPRAFIENVVTSSILEEITNAIEVLYGAGARWIMVWNIPAQGCSPNILWRFAATASSSDFDSLGCLKAYNEPIQHHNRLLHSAITALQRNHSSAHLIYVDYYEANIDILTNASLYGFDPSVNLKACCGTGGGQYNYNGEITCGNSQASQCDDPSKHVNWDGIHFTEAFYRRIAQFFLNGHYLHPPINFSATCNLDFSQF